MNICTYVSAVSLSPKQYVVAVYHRSKSLENLVTSKTAILQLLHVSHVGLVPTLGKKSGLIYDKEKYLRNSGRLNRWKDHDVLMNASALLLLGKKWSRVTGDHTLFLFDVLVSKTFNNEVLTMDHLREKKFIRI